MESLEEFWEDVRPKTSPPKPKVERSAVWVGFSYLGTEVGKRVRSILRVDTDQTTIGGHYFPSSEIRIDQINLYLFESGGPLIASGTELEGYHDSREMELVCGLILTAKPPNGFMFHFKVREPGVLVSAWSKEADSLFKFYTGLIVKPVTEKNRRSFEAIFQRGLQETEEIEEFWRESHLGLPYKPLEPNKCVVWVGFSYQGVEVSKKRVRVESKCSIRDLLHTFDVSYQPDESHIVDQIDVYLSESYGSPVVSQALKTHTFEASSTSDFTFWIHCAGCLKFGTPREP